ncbi:MAG: hypothetical protein GY932_02930 [Arcobacter sp.]|nr:hypothetical protein [Arcobacter sp.]
MEINNNLQLNQNSYVNKTRELEKISSVNEINNNSINPSEQEIVQKVNVKSSGLTQVVSNVNNGLTSLQIADAALNEQSKILDNVKEKLLQASNDTTSDQGREDLANEIKDLLKDFDDIASNTNYNEKTLLQNDREDKSISESLELQASSKSKDIIETKPIQSNTEGLELKEILNEDPNTFNTEDARSYIKTIDNAIDTINTFKSDLGSTQNKLQSSSSNLVSQHTQANTATSTIQNVDYAKETTNFSKQNILAQIGAYGIAQSSNINQNIVTRLLS